MTFDHELCETINEFWLLRGRNANARVEPIRREVAPGVFADRDEIQSDVKYNWSQKLKVQIRAGVSR